MHLPVYAAFVPAVRNADASTRIQQQNYVAQSLGSPAKAHIGSVHGAHRFVHRLIAAIITVAWKATPNSLPSFPTSATLVPPSYVFKSSHIVCYSNHPRSRRYTYIDSHHLFKHRRWPRSSRANPSKPLLRLHLLLSPPRISSSFLSSTLSRNFDSSQAGHSKRPLVTSSCDSFSHTHRMSG